MQWLVQVILERFDSMLHTAALGDFPFSSPDAELVAWPPLTPEGVDIWWNLLKAATVDAPGLDVKDIDIAKVRDMQRARTVLSDAEVNESARKEQVASLDPPPAPPPELPPLSEMLDHVFSYLLSWYEGGEEEEAEEEEEEEEEWPEKIDNGCCLRLKPDGAANKGTLRPYVKCLQCQVGGYAEMFHGLLAQAMAEALIQAEAQLVDLRELKRISAPNCLNHLMVPDSSELWAPSVEAFDDDDDEDEVDHEDLELAMPMVQQEHFDMYANAEQAASEEDLPAELPSAVPGCGMDQFGCTIPMTCGWSHDIGQPACSLESRLVVETHAPRGNSRRTEFALGRGQQDGVELQALHADQGEQTGWTDMLPLTLCGSRDLSPCGNSTSFCGQPRSPQGSQACVGDAADIQLFNVWSLLGNADNTRDSEVLDLVVDLELTDPPQCIYTDTRVAATRYTVIKERDPMFAKGIQAEPNADGKRMQALLDALIASLQNQGEPSWQRPAPSTVAADAIRVVLEHSEAPVRAKLKVAIQEYCRCEDADVAGLLHDITETGMIWSHPAKLSTIVGLPGWRRLDPTEDPNYQDNWEALLKIIVVYLAADVHSNNGKLTPGRTLADPSH